MTISQRVRYSLESIDFQKKTKIHKTLVGYFTIIRNAHLEATPNVSPVLDNIKKLVWDTYKIKLDLMIFESPGFDIYATIPTFSNMNPVDIHSRGFTYINPRAQNAVYQAIKDAKGKPVEAWVDGSTGAVGGLFSELEVRIAIPTGIINAPDSSAEILADAFLHEIGHVVTYFASFLYQTSTAWSVRYAIEALRGSGTREELTVNVNHLADIYTLDEVQKKSIIDSAVKEETMTAIILDAAEASTRSELGTGLADATQVEALADLFAVRMGAGVALASFVAKHGGRWNPSNKFNSHQHAMVEIGKAAILALTLSNPITAVSGLALTATAFWISSIGELNTRYDNPVPRIERIRNELVARVKQETNPVEQKAIVDEINAVNLILGELNNRKTLIQFILPLFSKNISMLRKQRRFQTNVEAMVNNPLFIRAIQLRGIADQSILED